MPMTKSFTPEPEKKKIMPNKSKKKLVERIHGVQESCPLCLRYLARLLQNSWPE